MMNQIPNEMLKQDLRGLRLKDMAQALDDVIQKAEKEKAGHLEFLAMLVEVQTTAMKQRSLDRRISLANFPRNMTFDNYDWGFQPGLNVEQLKNLAALNFIANHHPLLILGKTGSGKTHIATALGIEACKADLRVGFYKFQELMSYLYSTLADDTTDEAVGKLARLDLLIIDHIGFVRKKDEYPSLLFDLICACQDRVSLIVTSGISLEDWGTAFGNNAITNDIVDRLFHHANVINIRKARSYRTEGPNAPPLAFTENTDS